MSLRCRPAARDTLDEARESGQLTIGYLADARPFAYTAESGKPAGYAVALCSRVGDELRNELKLPSLAVEFVAVPFDERIHALEQHRIDILCGVEPTLARRSLMDFSIPILQGGTGVMIRADAPARLEQVLSGREPAKQPVWRATQGQAPERHVIAVIGGTTVEKAVIDRLRVARIVADVVAVNSTGAGMQMVLERRADAFFNDRALLLEARKLSPAAKQLVVLDRLFATDAGGARRAAGRQRLAAGGRWCAEPAVALGRGGGDLCPLLRRAGPCDPRLLPDWWRCPTEGRGGRPRAVVDAPGARDHTLR